MPKKNKLADFKMESVEKYQLAKEHLGLGSLSYSEMIADPQIHLKVLTEYDRMGGLIKNETYEGQKVATGTFYDFAKKEPRKKLKF